MATYVVHRATVLQMLLNEATLAGIEASVQGIRLRDLSRLRRVRADCVQENEALRSLFTQCLKHCECFKHTLPSRLQGSAA